jgi:hypothetical protein
LKNISYGKQALVLFILLTVGSALINASSFVASFGEQVIAFVQELITYAVILLLALTFLNVELISAKVRKGVGISFVLVTIVETIYPMVLYHDQTLPADYLFVFSVQLMLNIYIAKVISK